MQRNAEMKKNIYILVLILVLIAAGFVVTRRVKVVNAKCESQFGPCSEEVKNIVSEEVGDSFFSAKKDLGRRLSESSRVEKYNIRFDLPESLVVEVVEKKPEVALKFAEDRYFLFDESGNSLGEVQKTALPLIEVRDVPSDADISNVVKLFIELFKYYDVSTGTLDKFGLTVKVRNVDVIFPLEGEIDVLFGAMEVVLLQLNRSRENPTIDSAGNLTTIDLRYKNPVIR